MKCDTHSSGAGWETLFWYWALTVGGDCYFALCHNTWHSFSPDYQLAGRSGYFICGILSNTTQIYLHKPRAVILLSVKLRRTDISAVYLSWPHRPCGCSWFYNCSVQLPCMLQHSCSVSLTEAWRLQWPSTCCGLPVRMNENHVILCFENVLDSRSYNSYFYMFTVQWGDNLNVKAVALCDELTQSEPQHCSCRAPPVYRAFVASLISVFWLLQPPAPLFRLTARVA